VIGVAVGDQDDVDLVSRDPDPIQPPADVLEEVAVPRVDEDPLRSVDEKAVAVVLAGAPPDEPVEAVDNFHAGIPHCSRLFKKAISPKQS